MAGYSPEQQAENWKRVRAGLRRYLLALLAAALILIWGLGYAQGMIDGFKEGLAARQTKESK